jgi:hypothetical protein
MKRVVLFIMLLFAASAQAATDPGVDTGPVPQKDAARPAPETEQKTETQPKKDQPWPRPFVPSEQIGADSVVSFPADI